LSGAAVGSLRREQGSSLRRDQLAEVPRQQSPVTDRTHLDDAVQSGRRTRCPTKCIIEGLDLDDVKAAELLVSA
jgi:hypothetical protein